MANTCQASLHPAGALASSDQFVGSRAWDHKPSSTPKLNAGKIDQKKRRMAFCATSECWQVAPATPCATLYSSVRALALPQDTNLVSEKNRTFPGAGGERPPTRPEGKQALVSIQAACSGGGLPLHVHSCSAHGGLVLPGQTAWRSGQGSGRAVTAALRITAAVPNFQSPTAAD